MKLKAPSFAKKESEETIKKNLKHTAGQFQWRLNLPQKPNYANVYFYKKSKKIFNAPCYDLEMDRPPDSYKGDHYQVKTSLQQTESRLQYAKDEAERKRKDLSKQWKDLEIRERELRKNFKDFNSFLWRNSNKRARAEQKYEDMKNAKEKRSAEIEVMKEDVEKCSTILDSMRDTMKHFRIYEDFLEKVALTGNFRSVEQVLNRFLLLDETKRRVAKQAYKNTEDFHKKREQYVTNIEDFQLTFLSLSNELSEMRTKYDEARQKTSQWEIVIKDICKKHGKLLEDLSGAKMALRHMFEIAYYRLSKRNDMKKHDMDRVLRLNVTLKALETIDEKLGKLYGKKNVATSIAPVEEEKEFEIKPAEGKIKSITLPAQSRMDLLVSKWLSSRQRAMNNAARKSTAYVGDLAGFLKVTADEDALDEDYFPIKLSQTKWKLSKVRDFENRYRSALMGIHEDQLKKKIDEFTYTVGPEPKQKTSQHSLSHKSERKAKWAAAMAAQKVARHPFRASASGPSLLLPVPTTASLQSGLSDSILTLFVDGEEEKPLGEDVEDILSRRAKEKKIIERKFAAIADIPIYKEAHDKETEKTHYILPPLIVSTGSRDAESSRFYVKKQQAYYDTRKRSMATGSQSFVGVKKATRFVEDWTHLPRIDSKTIKRRKSRDAGRY